MAMTPADGRRSDLVGALDGVGENRFSHCSTLLLIDKIMNTISVEPHASLSLIRSPTCDALASHCNRQSVNQNSLTVTSVMCGVNTLLSRHPQTKHEKCARKENVHRRAAIIRIRSLFLLDTVRCTGRALSAAAINA